MHLDSSTSASSAGVWTGDALGGNLDTANDLTQEVFIQVLEYLAIFRGDSKIWYGCTPSQLGLRYPKLRQQSRRSNHLRFIGDDRHEIDKG